ncbi:MAG: hypothetical protein PF795_04285, partial [Kiritimatiellae bacterium]|nr:hypothetical protein [Kiritimatiellia bacterium]
PAQNDLTPFVRKLFPPAVACNAFANPSEAEERLEAFSVLQSREAMDVHRNWVDTYAEAYDPKVRALYLRAGKWTASVMAPARVIEERVHARLTELFQETDLYLLPVSSSPAPRSPMTHSQRSTLLTNTAVGSLGRLPVLTLPVREGEGAYGIQCLLPPDRWRDVLAGVFQV